MAEDSPVYLILLEYKVTPLWYVATESAIFRTSLTGLSVLLRNAIAIIYSRGDLQPPGIDFDSVPRREALFAVLRRYGMPDQFVKVLVRLHYGAK
jgi:hypothetical protein